MLGMKASVFILTAGSAHLLSAVDGYYKPLSVKVQLGTVIFQQNEVVY